jgi:predicted nucleic acid-binding protein
MPGILVDSNILIRLLDKDSKDHAGCVSALTPEHVDRFGLCMCAQTMIEFWVVCSRPKPQNGLGLSPSDLAMELERIKSIVPCVAEPADVATIWQTLVTRYQVSGKPAHDARIVALMSAYGMQSLLTLNAPDFRRYEGIRWVSPTEMLESSAP